MNFVSDKVVSRVMAITPAIAKEMLQTSDGNRKIRQPSVRALAGAMKRGEWQITNQGIGFDKKGRLKDGHHRLNAVIFSGETINMLVCMGMDDTSYEVIDSGISRSAADRMRLEGKYVFPLRLASTLAFSTNYPTVEQLKQLWCSEFGYNLALIVDTYPSMVKIYSCAAFKVTATIQTVLDRDSIDYVLSQYKALCQLDFDNMSACSRSLVRKLSSNRLHSNQKFHLLAAGMKVFGRKNKDNTKLYISDEDMVNAVALIKKTLLSVVSC